LYANAHELPISPTIFPQALAVFYLASWQLQLKIPAGSAIAKFFSMTTVYFHKSKPRKKNFAFIYPKQNVAASPRFETMAAASIGQHQAALKI